MTDLTLRKVTEGRNVPSWYDDDTVDHYEEVFGVHTSEILRVTPILDTDEVFYEMLDGGVPVGGVMVQQREYDARIRGLMVRPEHQGKGLASKLIRVLGEYQSKRLHRMCLSSKMEDSPPVTVAFLTTVPYPLSNPFAVALLRQGFRAMPGSLFEDQLSPWEHKAVTIYTGAMGIDSRSIFVFRKKVVDLGMHLPGYIMREMDQLTQLQAVSVSQGLDIKLRAAYQGRGRVTYRFDLCPVCKEMGSTEEDDAACQECYIHQTCRLPFEEPWRFKEDVDVSRIYWEAVQQYMTGGRKR